MTKKIDIHVHLFGSKADGCYISGKMKNKLYTKFILYTLGLKLEQADEYVEKLIEYVRESPIDQVVGLAYDAIYDEHGEVDEKRTEFYIPNDLVIRVAKEHDELLPGASINPNRKDAIDELERCAEAGVALVKWVPNAQGIDPADKKYKPFYQKLAQLKIPLLTHTGFERTFTAIEQDWGDPKRLKLALEEGVTVIAAHSGSSGPFRKEFLQDFIDMISEHENLYGDLSPLWSWKSRHLPELIEEEDQAVVERLVNGSDFPFPVASPYFFLKIPIKRRWELNKIKNPLTKDYEIKKALGVPDSVFNRGYELINK